MRLDRRICRSGRYRRSAFTSLLAGITVVTTVPGKNREFVFDAPRQGHVLWGAAAQLTPADVHHGLAEQRVAARATVLAAAYAGHPERFPAGLPQPLVSPKEVWISPPRPGPPNRR